MFLFLSFLTPKWRKDRFRDGLFSISQCCVKASPPLWLESFKKSWIWSKEIFPPMWPQDMLLTFLKTKGAPELPLFNTHFPTPMEIVKESL